MASRSVSTVAILLSLNLVFFSTTVNSSSDVRKRPSPVPPPKTPKGLLPPSTTPPSSSPPAKASCPKDILKLGVCADLLNDLVHLGTPEKTPCCSLIGGLADLDAAVCLCNAIKAKILGINLNVPVSLGLLLNYCGKSAPKGYKCT